MPVLQYDPLELLTVLSSVRFVLHGPRTAIGQPLWEANVTVTTHGRSNFRDARTVFIGAGESDPQLPGTILARCRVDEVRLRFGNQASPFQPPLRGQTAAEETFLVQADPQAWQSLAADQVQLNEALCLAGQFPLANYFQDLPTPLKVAIEGVLPGGLPMSELFAASSGLIGTGRGKMPDETLFAHPAPYLIEVESPNRDGALIVRLDPEQTALRSGTDLKFGPGLAEIRDYFDKLERRLNPADPAAPQRAALKWLRLERADARVLPEFWWRVPVGIKPTLQFADGAWRLLIADQSPAENDTPPRGVLSAAPTVAIDSTGVFASSKKAVRHSTATYTATLTGNATESLTFEKLRLGYNPVDAAARLRAIAGLPAPRVDDVDELPSSAALTGTLRTSDGRIDPPLLWAFVPQDDGWAQIPFFNLTEQLAVDAFPEPWVPKSPEPDKSLFRGGAIFGNDRTELYRPADGVLPWNIALLDAESIDGTWMFDAVGKLKNVSVTLENPEVTSEGTFWYATAAPTSSDAIPATDDWLTGLDTFALRTHRPGDVFACPFELAVGSLGFRRTLAAPFALAELTEFRWSYRPNANTHIGRVSKSDLADAAVPGDKRLQLAAPLQVWLTALASSRYPTIPAGGLMGLVWRRHPSHPCVQALPMTQNRVPANYPSQSRQLVPFELPVASVTHAVEVRAFENGALSAPIPAVFTTVEPQDWTWELVSPRRGWKSSRVLDPSPQWDGRLPLVPLGLPGTVLLPLVSPLDKLPDPSGFLRGFQFRHDLPVLDQLNAMTELPPQNTDDVAIPPRALHRSTYAQHWRTLAERALLAETDEAEAITLAADGKPAIRGLAEPELWNADISQDFTRFPGSLKFGDRGDPLQAILLAGESDDALRGFDGRFAVHGAGLALVAPGTPADFNLVGGSCEAVIQNGRMRDQRGLLRGNSTAPTDDLITTPIRVSGKEFTLLTLGQSHLALNIGGTEWQLWFKDLPASGSAPFRFDRSETLAASRRGVNDPAATGRDLGLLNGYEWRLGRADGEHSDWLPLGRLRFYPLTLESVALATAPRRAESAVILGRLQLPAWNGNSASPAPTDRPFPNLDTAVLATFENGALTKLVRAEPDSEPGVVAAPRHAAWPLVDGPSDSNAPVLLWTDRGTNGVVTNLLVGAEFRIPARQMRLVYTRHAVLWTTEAQNDLTLPLDGRPPAPVNFRLNPVAASESGVESLTLALDLVHAAHRLSASWVFRLGRREELWLEAKFLDDLLVLPAPNRLTASVRHGATREQALELPVGEARLDDRAVQFVWSRFSGVPNGLQVMPGWHLAERDESCRGGAIFSYDLVEQPGLPPKIEPRGGYFDIAFDCLWGRALQDAALPFDSDLWTEAAFNACAGSLLVEYTGGLTGQTWNSDLVISGLLEVKNLISWPTVFDADGTNENHLKAHAGERLSHWRHTIRILLSEHRPPRNLLAGSKADDCLLTVADGKTWTFPAVVEHQLIVLELDGAGKVSAAPAAERRWSAVQDVRFASPRGFYDHLRNLLARTGPAGEDIPERTTIDAPEGDLATNRWRINSRVLGHRGIEQRALMDALGITDSAVPGTIHAFEQTALFALGESILVEASVPLFLHSRGLTSSNPSPLFPTSGGNVSAGLAALSDYTLPESVDQPWLFLEVPFLGRSQSQSPANPTAELVRDPVRTVQATSPRQLTPFIRMLTHWANAPIQQRTTLFDRAATRFFRRLDASSVAEAWSRLNRIRVAIPATVSPSDLLPGAYTAAPSDATAVLSRAIPLGRLFDVNRESLPAGRNRLELAGSNPGDTFGWTPRAILEFQTAIAPLVPTPELYPFISWPLVLNGSQFLEPGVVRHAAATLLPTQTATSLQPTSLALAPFTSLGLAPFALGDPEPLLAVGELLTFDANRAKVVLAATRVIQAEANPAAARFNIKFRAWAGATRSRLAADSPAAFLRIRQLFRRGAVAIDVQVRFLLVEFENRPALTSRRSVALQAAPERLRQPQGQFTGTILPRLKKLESFELAPPLIRGAQSLRLNQRPLASANSPDWPWGFSGFRLSTVYRDGNAGSAGPRFPGTDRAGDRLWWQSISAIVTFAVPADRSLLPRQFRAPAIPGYLPASPLVPWPTQKEIKNSITGKQPVLPGARRVILSGLRPGVPFALRESLTVQWLDSTDAQVSGSVPMQPRMPRPILLPPNRANLPDRALRTWSSWFDLSGQTPPVANTVHSSEHPFAEFFTLRDGRAMALRISVRRPTDPEIALVPDADREKRRQEAAATSNASELPANWDSWLFAELTAIPDLGELDQWSPLSMTLVDGENAFAYEEATNERLLPGNGLRWFKPIDFSATKPPAVKKWFDAQRHGHLATVVVSVNVPSDAIKNSRQSARFSLRIVKAPFPQPFATRTFTFEDPEYNRELASVPARIEKVVPLAPSTVTLVLVADRQAYNTAGAIHYVFYRLENGNHGPLNPSGENKGTMTVSRRDATGLPFPLATFPMMESTLPTPTGTLNPLDIASLAKSAQPPLAPGDELVLELSIVMAGGPQVLTLRLPIVEQPTTPVPEAAYALLRRTHHTEGDLDDCPRFAWGPDATRIELLDPVDLTRQIVRRRAVFEWRDTVRRVGNQPANWAVQKTTVGGSTHFPPVET